MNNFLKCILCLVLLSFLSEPIISQSSPCDQQIVGKVFDLVTNQELPFATVSIEETGKGVVTNEHGEFVLENICEDEMHLEVRFLGYKTVVHHHDFHHEDPMIYLAPDETLLESIVIEGNRLEAFQSIAIQNLEINKVALLRSSVGDLTEQLSGISILKTGSNIAKPIIHGLHSNRVLVVNNGLRHSYQAWGEGHAPEIDPSLVNEIEVVLALVSRSE